MKWAKNIWGKIKEYDYKKLLVPRNYIIVGCVALLAVAVIFNAYLASPVETGNDNSDGKLGNPVLVDANPNSEANVNADEEDDEADFFAIAIINRQRVRDEAMDVLQQVADNPDSLQAAKSQAVDSIESIMREMNQEVNIETLIKSKGFTDCIAVISGSKCSIVVKSEELERTQVAQIKDIVINETTISAGNVNIINKP